eukprot:1161836-Pelagomonas_calceolata.AAC.5
MMKVLETPTPHFKHPMAIMLAFPLPLLLSQHRWPRLHHYAAGARMCLAAEGATWASCSRAQCFGYLPSQHKWPGCACPFLLAKITHEMTQPSQSLRGGMKRA